MSSIDKLFGLASKYKQEGRKRLYDSLAIALSSGFSYVLTEATIHNFSISISFWTLYFIIESIVFILALLMNKAIWDRNRVIWAKLNEDRIRLKSIEEHLIELKKELDSSVRRIKTLGLASPEEQAKILNRYERFEESENRLMEEREKLLVPRTEKPLPSVKEIV